MKIFFLLLFLALLAPAVNSQSIKLKITGVTVAEGEDVIAFETSDTSISNVAGGSGQVASPPVFEMVKIKKLAAASTSELFKRSVNGMHTAEVAFEFNDANGTLFYKIVIKDVTVNHFSYLSPECAGCTKLFHQVWFDYAIIEVTDVTTNVTVKYNRKTRMTS